MRLPRDYRPAVALVLGAVLVVFVSVIAQLTTQDGILEALFASITAVGIAGALAAVVLAVRVHRRLHPDDSD